MALEDLRSRLAAYLACHVPERAAGSLGPLQELRGGWASSVYSVRLPLTAAGPADGGTAVLKLYGPDEEGRRHAVREWRALTHLRSRGVLVPGVIAFEPDARHLGRPFVVMEHVAGTAL